MDIEQIALLTGVHIIRRTLPDKTAAILHRVDRGTWYLYLNDRHCIERQRFTVGHELSHVYHTRDTWPPTPPEKNPAKIRQLEKIADASAGNFLMPGWYVRSWLAEAVPVPEMARRFVVSEEAMRIRVEEIVGAERKRAQHHLLPVAIAGASV